jgi:hypothetical protein
MRQARAALSTLMTAMTSLGLFLEWTALVEGSFLLAIGVAGGFLLAALLPLGGLACPDTAKINSGACASAELRRPCGDLNEGSRR